MTVHMIPLMPADCADQLQSALDLVQPGDTVLFPPHARYETSQTIRLSGWQDVTVFGARATIASITEGDQKRATILIADCHGVTIGNLLVEGANPTPGVSSEPFDAALVGQHGYKIMHSTDVTLGNCAAKNTHGDLVYVGADKGQPTSRRIRVLGGCWQGSGRQGFALTACIGFEAAHAYIGEVKRTVIDLEPNRVGDVVAWVHLHDLVLGPHGLNAIASASAQRVDAVGIEDIWHPGGEMTMQIGRPDVRRSHWLVRRITAPAHTKPKRLRFTAVDHLTLDALPGPTELTDCTEVTQ